MRFPALRDSQRSVIFRWGSLATFAAIALSPLNGSGTMRSSGAITNMGVAFAPLPPYVPPRIVTARRDPFVPEAEELPQGSVVQAIVLGPTAHALVHVGSRIELVGIGDRVGGTSVVIIDKNGIWLADGTHIPMREAP